ncbi:MAG: tyrosine-type recombinase/integrase [Candidatus Poribacteria bacterium]|nr:tyrosine-type recombinase/integrase [Candidatus Poribacteria bacterium]
MHAADVKLPSGERRRKTFTKEREVSIARFEAWLAVLEEEQTDRTDPLVIAFLEDSFVPSQQELKSYRFTVQCGQAIKRFLSTEFTDLRLSDVSRLHGDRLLSFYGNLSPRTRNMYLQKFKQAMNYAVDLELVAVNPLTRVKQLTVDNRRTRALTMEQFVALIRQAEITDAMTMFLVMGLTGLRPKNVRLLMKGELIDDRIEIPPSKMKNARWGIIPISAHVQLVLKDCPDSLCFPAVGTSETPKTHRNLFRTFDHVRQRADLGWATMYDLRHFFASQLAKQGATEQQIGRLLCHVGHSVTSRYVHHDLEDLRPFVEELSERYITASATQCRDSEGIGTAWKTNTTTNISRKKTRSSSTVNRKIPTRSSCTCPRKPS